MVKNRKIDVPLGEVTIEDGMIKLCLSKTKFMPNKMYYKDKGLYYGSPSGNNIRVRDGKSYCVFLYNLHIYVNSIFVGIDNEEVERCMAEIYLKLITESKDYGFNK